MSILSFSGKLQDHAVSSDSLIGSLSDTLIPWSRFFYTMWMEQHQLSWEFNVSNRSTLTTNLIIIRYSTCQGIKKILVALFRHQIIDRSIRDTWPRAVLLNLFLLCVPILNNLSNLWDLWKKILCLDYWQCNCIWSSPMWPVGLILASKILKNESKHECIVR